MPVNMFVTLPLQWETQRKASSSAMGIMEKTSLYMQGHGIMITIKAVLNVERAPWDLECSFNGNENHSM